MQKKRKKGAKKSPKKRKNATIEFRGHVQYKLSLQSNCNAFAPWRNPDRLKVTKSVKKVQKSHQKKRKKVTIEFRGHVKYKLSLQSNFNAFAPWRNPDRKL